MLEDLRRQVGAEDQRYGCGRKVPAQPQQRDQCDDADGGKERRRRHDVEQSLQGLRDTRRGMPSTSERCSVEKATSCGVYATR